MPTCWLSNQRSLSPESTLLFQVTRVGMRVRRVTRPGMICGLTFAHAPPRPCDSTIFFSFVVLYILLSPDADFPQDSILSLLFSLCLPILGWFSALWPFLVWQWMWGVCLQPETCFLSFPSDTEIYLRIVIILFLNSQTVCQGFRRPSNLINKAFFFFF